MFIPTYTAKDKAWNDKQQIWSDLNVNLQQLSDKYMFYIQRNAPVNQLGVHNHSFRIESVIVLSDFPIFFFFWNIISWYKEGGTLHSLWFIFLIIIFLISFSI